LGGVAQQATQRSRQCRTGSFGWYNARVERHAERHIVEPSAGAPINDADAASPAVDVNRDQERLLMAAWTSKELSKLRHPSGIAYVVMNNGRYEPFRTDPERNVD
jgi:hypothetical protein